MAMLGWHIDIRQVWLVAAALVVAAPAVAQAPLQAQAQLLGASAPPTQQFAPANTQIPGSTGSPVAGPTLAPPSGPARPSAAAPAPAMPQVQSGQAALAVSARFGRDANQQITNGLTWRVYPARLDPARPIKPIKEDKTASPVFVLPVGEYVVHVTFGLASAVRSVNLRAETAREVFELPAGGIRLEGRVGDAKIPPSQITFDVYQGSQFDTGDRKPIAQGIGTGDVVVVPEGTYYIVSNYGDGNAVVRSDIRVQAAKLTDVVVNHRAAVVVLKLVSNFGGDALANTEWTVLTPGGDVIKESIGAFPKVVLSEGEYRAIARNEGRTYERNFKVTTGVDGEIEVLAR